MEVLSLRPKSNGRNTSVPAVGSDGHPGGTYALLGLLINNGLIADGAGNPYAPFTPARIFQLSSIALGLGWISPFEWLLDEILSTG